MKDCLKVLARLDDPSREWKSQELSRRIDLVEQFVKARKCSTTDVGQMFQICQELLMQPKIDEAVRVGDIYGCMIESYYANGDMGRSAALLSEMASVVPADSISFCKNFLTAIVCLNMMKFLLLQTWTRNCFKQFSKVVLRLQSSK
jgi:hypothetical protein